MSFWCERSHARALFGVLGGASGQATVESAFLIPVVLLGLIVLIQPGIVLYDRMVMNAAASEACRLLTTKPQGEGLSRYEDAAKRALASVPQQDCFHVHEPCSWEVSLVGSEGNDASVVVRNKIKPLPLFDWGAAAMGILDSDGLMTIEVSSESAGWPGWVASSAGGMTPKEWISSWDD